MAHLLQALSGLLLLVALALSAPQQRETAPAVTPATASEEQPQEGTAQVGIPQIDWGLCQTLQPSEGERESKKLVIQKCLDVIPIPDGNVTAKQADSHREQITTCALKAEGWFNADGSYKFDRAREEIKTKKLSKEIESSIVEQHDACHNEAIEKFAQATVQQIQLYQACMDYHIARICRIQVVGSAEAQAAAAGQPGQSGQEGSDY